MSNTHFQSLPEEIQQQLDSLLPETGLVPGEAAREQLAAVWQEKFNLFTGQINNLGMEFVSELPAEDQRGAILLTYSGSLISLGTLRDSKRWLEYASIKFRVDVPDLIHGNAVTLEGPLQQGRDAVFSGCAIKKSSSLFRIAVCPLQTPLEEQELRIREATIFLTNGFVHINRSLQIENRANVEQFTLKSIVAYVAKKNECTQAQARSIIDDYIATVETGILLGERVSFGKFGSASLRLQEARKARILKNPRSGEELLVPAKAETMVPRFSFSTRFKEKSALVDPGTLFKNSKD